MTAATTGASAASSASGTSSAAASGFQHRHAVDLAHAALDLGDPGHRPVDHPGQLGLGQAPAAPLGGDLPAQGLLVVRGGHPPVPLPVCRVSQSTSVLARYWPRASR